MRKVKQAIAILGIEYTGGLSSRDFHDCISVSNAAVVVALFIIGGFKNCFPKDEEESMLINETTSNTCEASEITRACQLWPSQSVTSQERL